MSIYQIKGQIVTINSTKIYASFLVQMAPHTYSHILWQNESDFKKPGVRQPAAWFKNIYIACIYASYYEFVPLMIRL